MIKVLAESRIKYNKSRTILTIIAIMLTTMLLMGVGTSAVGILDMNKQQAIAENNIHAMLRGLTYKQINILKNHIDIEALDISEIFASVEYGKMQGFLNCQENIKDGIYYGVGNLIEGRYPQNADEICGPRAFFERISVEPVIGNTMSLSFRVDSKGEIITRDFVICGIVSQRDVSKLNVSDDRLVYGAIISQALIKEFLTEEEREYNAAIRVFDEDKLSYDEIQERIEGIAADIGCDEDNISFNKEYLFAVTDPNSDVIQVTCMIAVLIIIFSGIVIYSIYYVGVITDVQEIGKLRALGASKKQIKQMLLAEGMFEMLLSIPAGVLLGYIIPYIGLPIVMKKASSVMLSVSYEGEIHMFSFNVVLLVVISTIVTVIVSLQKPMKMAAKISPMEAIRYQESSSTKKQRKGNTDVNVWSLSMANITRNRKRSTVTIISMGFSCVLFMSLAGTLNSMRPEDIARRQIPKGDFRLGLDFSDNDKEYPENNLDSLQQQNIFNDEFMNKLQNIDGITVIEKGKYSLISSDYPSFIFENGSRSAASTFSREEAKELQKQVKQGKIDYDKMLEENGVICTVDYFMEDYNLHIGDVIPVTLYDGNREIQLSMKITASMDIGISEIFLIPDEIYNALDLSFDSTAVLNIYVEKDKYDSVKEVLQEINDSNQYFYLYSLDEELRIGEMSVAMIKYPMYAVLVMVAVIGFMNLINTMITSIVTRKQELEILHSIGMSDRQMSTMLAGEGMFFTMGTLAASVTVGNALGYLIFIKAKESGFMSVSAYHYPVAETLLLAAVLIIGQLVVTYFIGKRVRRK